MSDREQSYREMIAQFPDSPLPHFSLGRYLIEQGRFEEGAASLEECLRFDPEYAAALLSLGDAYAAIDENDKAKDAWNRCADAAIKQGHPTLAGEARERIEEL